MTLVSFQKPDADGIRWSLGWRCYKNADGTWTLERWTGPVSCWQQVATPGSYASCRMIAGARSAS